jgi:lysozyme
MFAYAKTSLGTSHADPSFANNYAAIKAAGLIRGAYHTFDATVDGAAQADYFLARLGTLPQGDLPPALDVEPQGTLYTGQVVVPVSTMLSGINAWMTHVKAATGRTPVILSSRYVLDQFGSDISGISSYPLWVYGINVSCPSLPSAWQKWALWDYSGTGKVPGITGIVDLVKFNGTQANLKSLQ